MPADESLQTNEVAKDGHNLMAYSNAVPGLPDQNRFGTMHIRALVRGELTQDSRESHSNIYSQSNHEG